MPFLRENFSDCLITNAFNDHICQSRYMSRYPVPDENAVNLMSVLVQLLNKKKLDDIKLDYMS